MPTALVLSPHLDDAVFSCGGAMALLADAGWRVCMATAFTRSVLPATGFALACQLDKGLPAEIDYMALRREEDAAAAAILAVADLRWLDLPEAPHRGYGFAAALFGDVSPADTVWQDLSRLIAGLVTELHPALILAPQGLGGHVDHRQMIRAVQDVVPGGPVAFYRDTPYAIRNVCAVAHVQGAETRVGISGGLSRKIEAACAYGSQIGFQFGGREKAAASLHSFAVTEGSGEPAERFRGVSLPV